MDPEMPLEIKNARVMIARLDLKPVKEAWVNENSKYEEILNMENDRVSKPKDIVNSLLATGANAILIASGEVDQVIKNLLVANKVFAVRVSIEEIEYLSRYTRAKPVRMMDDLKKSDILGKADHMVFLVKHHASNTYKYWLQWT